MDGLIMKIILVEIILVGGLVAMAIRQRINERDQNNRDAEDNERRKRDLIWTIRAPWQGLAQIYREVDERERQMEEEFQARKWSFVNTFCPELEADMSVPTVGELKRVLQLPKHQAVRDRLIGWQRDESMEDPFGHFYVTLILCQRWEDWTELPRPENSYLGYSKDHVREALQAWLKELVDPQLPLELPEVETALAREGL